MLTHLEGLELLRKNKGKYEIELELDCLNSDFICSNKLNNKLKIYESIKKENSVLKESEFHEVDRPYYEMSFFSNFQNLIPLLKYLDGSGVNIDLVHYSGESYSLTNFMSIYCS